MIWLPVTVLAATLAVFAYWRLERRRYGAGGAAGSLRMTFALVAAGFLFCGWSLALEQERDGYRPRARTVALAIAFDLSPSMLAVPDPALAGDMPPRYRRATAVLLDYLDRLEEQGATVFVAVSGFTREAQLLMGWDRSTAQAREIVQRVLTPELFSTSGTSIEAATDSLLELFAMLPADLQRNSRRLGIVVSDGEDTVAPWSIDYAVEDLEGAEFDVIALQTGLPDTAEGIPEYDEFGEFRGFLAMAGQRHTQPDVAAMARLADAAGGRGLYLRAEGPGTVSRLMRFSGYAAEDTAVPDRRMGAVLGMFAAVALLCIRLLR